MSYEKFIEELRQSLLNSTHYEGSQIYFKKKGEIPAATDDRLFIDFKINSIFRESCAFFIKELYSEYLKGTPIDTIKKEIVNQLLQLEETMCFDNVQKLGAYKTAKDYLFIRPLNLMRNKNHLKNIVYKTIGDIALVLYIKLDEAEGSITSMKVAQEFLESWDIEPDLVFKMALYNTFYCSPPRIYCLSDIYFNSNYHGDDFMASEFKLQDKEHPLGYCISTSAITNGAIALFLPGVAKKLGALLGENYFIEFPSINEALIYRASQVQLEEIQHRLKHAALDLDNKEFLSKYIYYYDIQTDTLSFIQNDQYS